jgi:A/G-specific adenine glycosylase
MAGKVESFQQVVWDYYRHAGRHDLPWRQPEPGGQFDPYKIAVSEIMLQQTQVSRVVPKFETFTSLFPDVQTLAKAPLSSVLLAWSGLGYNRRAKFLWQAAVQVADEYNGQFPKNKEELVTLPGIGANTAGAILVYAFNRPEVFIETNIRTVFIHHFFKDRAGAIPDKELFGLVERTLPKQDPRLWYWALMDYGTYLKQTIGNVTRRSAHYSKQSRFEGSKRQIRGQVLRLLAGGPQTKTALQESIGDDRLSIVLEDLMLEGFVEQQNHLLKLRDL